ncbi:hypothetical protein GCM10010502_69850 [Kitasatospora aureofaciens]|uniref:Fe/B12 periplasmic-binding domain-containing protein n=3 Tax=Kitasatospora aureofaciens TaxID=1894 RepID=A0A8H9I1R8_KITAU|nr:hypothetical protein B6264_03050 [Kitasatospora aureofaciens]GGV05022.1 hypothetical protein GCM10010502_69850 [Kitasatospora aureofaciens]
MLGRMWFWLGLQAGTLFGVGFVTWLTDQTLYEIGAVCPYCIVVWIATIPLFWYTTPHNVRHGVIPLPARWRPATELARGIFRTFFGTFPGHGPTTSAGSAHGGPLAPGSSQESSMRSRVLCGMAAAVALLVTGCGSGGSAESGDAGATAANGGASSAAAAPVKVTDCAGKETVFDSAPKKIVTSNASSLEMLLKLGAGDRVIGTGFPPGKGTLPADVADAGAKVPVLGDMVIPKEKLLGSGADLYVETFADMGGMGGGMGTAPTAQEYQAAGIKRVFLHSTACAATAPTTVRDLTGVEGDIKSLGQVTGTSAKADALVADMEKKVGAVKTALAGVAADKRPGYFFFDFDAGTKQPMAVGNRQVANAVITLAGARNVFGDVDGDFKPVSWEDVVARNPDWIQLGVRNRGSDAENKKAFDDAEKFLREFPATKGLKAVQEGHFVRIGSEVTTIAGTRNADTVQQIAHTLFPDQVKDAQ